MPITLLSACLLAASTIAMGAPHEGPPAAADPVLEDLLFMLEARDQALATLALPYRAGYEAPDYCTHEEEGWWFRRNDQFGVLNLGGCSDAAPDLNWAVWDGGRSRVASTPGRFDDHVAELLPPDPSRLVLLRVTSQRSAGPLGSPLLPAGLGLTMGNTPWPHYLRAMKKVRTTGPVELEGKCCIEVSFDMDREAPDSEYRFPWKVVFDLESLLAVRIEGFGSYESALHSHATAGLEGEPPTVEIGGQRWSSISLAELLESRELSPGVHVPIRGRVRLGEPWDSVVTETVVDFDRITQADERIASMLRVEVREDAAIEDDTLARLGGGSAAAANNVTQTIAVAELLEQLGCEPPEEAIAPFSDSFFEADAVHFVSAAEGRSVALRDVLESFPAEDRVLGRPTLQRTLAVAEGLGFHGLVRPELDSEDFGSTVWVLTTVRDDAQAFGASDEEAPGGTPVLGRRQGDEVLVISRRWTQSTVSLERFEEVQTGPVLLLSREPRSEWSRGDFELLAGLGGAACFAAGLLALGLGALRRRPSAQLAGVR